jgi:hypothetical protein
MTTTSTGSGSRAKLLVYLDEYKMYSISSQIFEGLTEDIVHYSERRKDVSEQQRGPVGSGRILADIASDTDTRQERRYLFDYAYTVFEKRLLDDGLVLDLDSSSSPDQLGRLTEFSYLRVTGNLRLIDLAAATQMTRDFNKMMAALNYITSAGDRDASRELLRLALHVAKGQKKSEIQRQLKALDSPGQPVLDPKYLENLVYMLEFSFGDHLEAQVRLTDTDEDEQPTFTAILDREALRENVTALVKKYSRRSERPFSILGLVTQHARLGTWHEQAVAEVQPADASGQGSTPAAADESPAIAGSAGTSHLKSALRVLMGQIGNIEDTFFGRLPQEVIIDPIAIYRTL